MDGAGLDKVKAALISKRDELMRLKQSGDEDAKPVELDQQRVGRLSRMDAMQSQAMSMEQKRRREIELVRIDKALKRIDAGDYGFCVKCDEPIAAERLEFDPAAPFCIECASRSEKR